MNSASRHLTLFVPGLLEPLPAVNDVEPPVLDFRSLEVLLSRADVRQIRGDTPEAALCGLFSLETVDSGDLPIAALTRLADTGQRDQQWWLRADPVHLRPDQDRLLLFGLQASDVQQDEADALIADLNQVYREEGYRFEAPDPVRWYLGLSDDPAIQTSYLGQVIGRDINARLPKGDQAVHWHAVLNEIQMLLHGSDVNRNRETRGQAPINSVWFWGSGQFPNSVQGDWKGVWSQGPLARGLARASNIPDHAVPANAESWLEQASDGRHLVTMESVDHELTYGDLPALRAALSALNTEWFECLVQALKKCDLDVLEIIPGDGKSYRITRSNLRRFWRRRTVALPVR
jgi:hypothetical protein